MIACGDSNRQVRSLARHVEDKVRAKPAAKFYQPKVRMVANVVLVDLGDIVVHVMQPAIRSYYNLEELWGSKGPERVRKALAV